MRLASVFGGTSTCWGRLRREEDRLFGSLVTGRAIPSWLIITWTKACPSKSSGAHLQEGFLRTVPPLKMPPFDPLSINRSEKPTSNFVFVIGKGVSDKMPIKTD